MRDILSSAHDGLQRITEDIIEELGLSTQPWVNDIITSSGSFRKSFEKWLPRMEYSKWKKVFKFVVRQSDIIQWVGDDLISIPKVLQRVREWRNAIGAAGATTVSNAITHLGIPSGSVEEAAKSMLCNDLHLFKYYDEPAPVSLPLVISYDFLIN